MSMPDYLLAAIVMVPVSMLVTILAMQILEGLDCCSAPPAAMVPPPADAEPPPRGAPRRSRWLPRAASGPARTLVV